MRELHDQLSRYVRYAAEGGRGRRDHARRRVARLSPLEIDDPLADLRARGLVQEPSRQKRQLARRKRLASSAPVSDLVAEQRR